MKLSQDLADTLSAEVAQGLVPVLVAEPGSGVQAFLAELAAGWGTTTFLLGSSRMCDARDIADRVDQVVDHATGHLGQRPILVIDEADRATPEVFTMLVSLATTRRIGTTVLPRNVVVVMLGNVTTGRSPFDMLGSTEPLVRVRYVEPAAA